MNNYNRPSPVKHGHFGISWPLVIAVACCVGLLIHNPPHILGDADTYWHLAAGQWILQHQAIPRVDPFSYTKAGLPWINHEWLSQALLASVYKLGGWSGLVFLTIVSLALTLAYLLRFLLSRIPPIYALLFTALAYATLGGYLYARPHVLTWPLVVIWVGTLINASEKNQSPPWWLLIAMVVWTNLHTSALIGLSLLPLIALDAVLRVPACERTTVFKKWFVFGIFASLATLLTPAGWKIYWITMQGFTLKHLTRIAEWAPYNFSGVSALELWLLVLLTMALTGYLRLPIFRLLLLFGLLHEALTHSRLVTYFGMAVPMIIASPFGNLYKQLSNANTQASSLDAFFERLASRAKFPAILVGVILIGVTAYLTAQSGKQMPYDGVTPAQALDTAIQAGATGNVLNQYHFGGYLAFRGIPVFIDGRAELYGNEHTDAYFDAVDPHKPDKVQKTLDSFKVSWTLLSPESPLVLYLNTQPDWRKIYEDKIAVVHMRRPAP